MKADEKAQIRFLRDIRSHQMTVLRDDGVYRHLSFGRPGSSLYRYDLITWPGYLCVTGDMGTWAFSRLYDMFAFFKGGFAGGINPYYWSEKLEAGTGTARREMCFEFDGDAFASALDEWHREWLEDEERDTERDEDVANSIRELKAAGYHDENTAYRAVDDSDLPGFQCFDFFEGHRFYQYTSNFLWICYAIVWGIERYKNKKLAENAAATFLRLRVAAKGPGSLYTHAIQKGLNELCGATAAAGEMHEPG